MGPFSYTLHLMHLLDGNLCPLILKAYSISFSFNFLSHIFFLSKTPINQILDFLRGASVSSSFLSCFLLSTFQLFHWRVPAINFQALSHRCNIFSNLSKNTTYNLLTFFALHISLCFPWLCICFGPFPVGDNPQCIVTLGRACRIRNGELTSYLLNRTISQGRSF